MTTPEHHAEAILRAAGSSLANYTMPGTRQAILDAVREAMGPGWQPIETAPRDGTSILIYAHGMCIEAQYCPGSWSDDTPVSPAEYDGAIWCAFDDQIRFEIEEGATPDGSDCHGAATHWQPLPLPPSDGGL